MSSRLSSEPLGGVDLCGLCGGWVTPEIVRGLTRVDERVWLDWLCPCGQRGRSETTWTAWKPILQAWLEARAAGRPFVPLDDEAVGRVMQGWRIDLDAVETPADMQLMWDYQERTAPRSVRREA